LHQARISRLLKNDHAKFQVTLQKLYDGDKSTFVVMVQCAKEHINSITTKLKNIDKSHKVEFFPWSAYINLTKEQKRTVFNEHRAWNYTFKSIVDDGFNNNNDSATIIKNTKNDKGQRKIEVLTVTEYLAQFIHPLTDTTLFKYIYPSILNKRELVVSLEHMNDAESFVHNIKRVS
jgi:hypothetical protein